MSLAPSHQSPRVIFLHVPKTAGRTLTHLMLRHYPAGAIVTVGERDPFDTVVSPDDRVDWLKQRSAPELASIAAVKGHMRFGLHETLTGPNSYVTLIREPVARVRSVFTHLVAGRKGAGLLGAGRQAHKPDYAIAERVRSQCPDPLALVRSGLCLEVDNGQTRRVSGIDPPYGECTREMLDVAKENLRTHFAVVGVTDRFAEAVVLMRRRYHWGGLLHQPLNPARRPASHGGEADIAAHNALDMELYAYARSLMDAQVAEAGSDFQAEVAALGQANARLRAVARGFPKESVPIEFFDQQVREAGERLLAGGDDAAVPAWEYVHWRMVQQAERMDRLWSAVTVARKTRLVEARTRLESSRAKYARLRDQPDRLDGMRLKATDERTDVPDRE